MSTQSLKQPPADCPACGSRVPAVDRKNRRVVYECETCKLEFEVLQFSSQKEDPALRPSHRQDAEMESADDPALDRRLRLTINSRDEG